MLHLNNSNIYEIITEAEASTAVRQLEGEIMNWISVARRRHGLDDHKYAYLRHHTRANSKDPFSYFYLMYKVHKQRRSNGETPTRPVCSDVGQHNKSNRKMGGSHAATLSTVNGNLF